MHNVNIYPNPATYQAELSIEGLQKDATIPITDLTEKTISTSNIKADQNTLIIDVKEYLAGIYYVKILNSDFNRTQKLIINK